MISSYTFLSCMTLLNWSYLSAYGGIVARPGGGVYIDHDRLLHYNPNDNNCAVGSGDVPAQVAKTAFDNNPPHICVNNTIFATPEAFKNRAVQKDVLKDITEAKLWLLINYFYDGNVITYDGQGYAIASTAFRDDVRAAAFVQNLDPSVLSGIVDNNQCLMIGTIVNFMTPEQINKLNPTCLITALMKNYQAPFEAIKRISIKPEKVLMIRENYWKSAANVINTNFLQMIHSLPVQSARHIIAQRNTCANFDETIFTNILYMKDLSALINPVCFSKLPEAVRKDTNYVSYIHNLPANVFAKANFEMADVFFKGMTAEQASNFNADIPRDSCRHAKLHLVPIHAFGHLPEECILSWMSKVATRSNELPRLGRRWSYIGSKVFSSLKPTQYQLVLKAINPRDWAFISGENVQNLLKNSSVCKHVPYGAFKEHHNITVGVECFTGLTPQAQAAALVVMGQLPDDTLKSVTKDMVNGWSYNDINGVSSNGFSVLRYLSRLSNAQKIIEQLGTGVTERVNPCKAIDMDTLRNVPILAQFITPECFISSGVSISDAEAAEYNLSRLLSFRSYEQIVANNASKWDELTKETLHQFVSAGNFCEKLQLDIFRKINTAAYSAFGPECVAKLQFLGQLTKEELGFFEPSAFAKLAKGKAGLIADKLDDNHFGSLGVDVSGADNYGTSITKPMLQSYPESRIRVMSANLLGSIPAESYDGAFATKERVAALENVEELKLAQVKNTLLEAYSAKQIEKLGINHKGTAEDPITLFDQRVQSKMASDAQEAIKKRQTDSSATSLNIGLAAILGATLLIYIAPLI